MLSATNRLSSQDEVTWAHCRLRFSNIYQALLIFGGICILFGFLAASREQNLSLDNFPDPKFFLERSKYTNGSVYISESVDAQQDDHPLYHIYRKDHLRYDYGNSFYNYCKVKKKGQEIIDICSFHFFTHKATLKIVMFNNNHSAFCDQRSASSIAQRLLSSIFPSYNGDEDFCTSMDEDNSPYLLQHQGFPLIIITTVFSIKTSCKKIATKSYINSFNTRCTYVFISFLSSFLYFFFQPSVFLLRLRMIIILVFITCVPTVHYTYTSYLGFKPCHNFDSSTTQRFTDISIRYITNGLPLYPLQVYTVTQLSTFYPISRLFS
uniref:Transmembrane protein n=1 Tax=Heterorhabditis bacteriophora TaxID=37862 RepID=A0A1I7WN33_HETBA